MECAAASGTARQVRMASASSGTLRGECERAMRCFMDLRSLEAIERLGHASGPWAESSHGAAAALPMKFLADVLVRMGLYKLAGHCIGRVLAMRGVSADVRAETELIRAGMKLETDGWRRALQIVRRAELALCARWMVASARARIHCARGNLRAAERCLRVARDEGGPPLPLDLIGARILLESGKCDAALGALSACRRRCERPGFSYLLAEIGVEESEAHFRTGNYDLALDALRKVMEAVRRGRGGVPYLEARACLLMSKACLRSGKLDQSRKFLEWSQRAVKTYGWGGCALAREVRVWEGVALGSAGDHGPSLASFRAAEGGASRSSPLTARFSAELNYYRGEELEKTNPRSAVRCYAACFRRAPRAHWTMVSSMGRVAVVFHKMGMLGTARDRFCDFQRLLFAYLKNFSRCGSMESFRNAYGVVFDYSIFTCIRMRRMDLAVAAIDASRSICCGAAQRLSAGAYFSQVGVLPAGRTVLLFHRYGRSKLIRVVLRNGKQELADYVQFDEGRVQRACRTYGRKIDCLFSVGASGGVRWELPVALEGLRGTARALREANEYMYDLLVRGAEPFLPTGPEDPFVIVPHGILFYVPFACLRDRKTGKYMLEKYAFSVSASLFAHGASERALLRGRIARMGHGARRRTPGLLVGPSGEGADLRDIVKRSGRGLALAVGRSFGSESFRRELAASLPDFIYFGTHEIRAKSKGMEPRYKSTGGVGLPAGGYLGPGDFERENLIGVKFAFLNTCNSLLGCVTANGDVLGLRRSLQSAGVPLVIGAVTYLHDYVARFVAREFFKNLYVGRMSKVQSLRAAMMKLAVAGGPEGARVRDLTSLWAAYQCYGSE